MYTDYKTDDKPTPKAAWSESHFVASVLTSEPPQDKLFRRRCAWSGLLHVYTMRSSQRSVARPITATGSAVRSLRRSHATVGRTNDRCDDRIVWTRSPSNASTV